MATIHAVYILHEPECDWRGGNRACSGTRCEHVCVDAEFESPASGSMREAIRRARLAGLEAARKRYLEAFGR